MECPTIVQKTVCVEAKVTVTPNAEIGDVESFCVGGPRIDACPVKSSPCTYMVNQLLCVRFPLTISADAMAKPTGIVCDIKDDEPCSRIPPPCKQTCEHRINRNRGNPKFPLILGMFLTLSCTKNFRSKFF